MATRRVLLKVDGGAELQIRTNTGWTKDLASDEALAGKWKEEWNVTLEVGRNWGVADFQAADWFDEENITMMETKIQDQTNNLKTSTGGLTQEGARYMNAAIALATIRDENEQRLMQTQPGIGSEVNHRIHNFQLCLDRLIETITRVMKNLNFSDQEMVVKENVEAVFRVVMIADMDEPRTYKKGGKLVQIPDDVTINKVESNPNSSGTVASIPCTISMVSGVLKAMKPKLQELKMKEGSKQTEESIWACMMAPVSKSVSAVEEILAPGVKRTRTAGFQAELTVLGEGSRVPSRYSRHCRNVCGILNDAIGLMSAIRTGANNKGEPIWRAIKKNMMERLRDPRQRAILKAVDASNGVKECQAIVNSLLSTILSIPERKQRFYIPPLACLVSAKMRGISLVDYNFVSSPEQGVAVINQHPCWIAAKAGVSQGACDLMMLVTLLGTSFVSSSILKAMMSGVETKRSKIMIKKSRPEKDGSYELKSSGQIEAFQDKPEFEETSNAGGGWQISVSDSFGLKSSYNTVALAGLLMGQGSGQEERVSISAQMKAIVKSLRKDGKSEIEMVRWANHQRFKVKMEAEGIFSAGMDETADAEDYTGRFFGGGFSNYAM